MEVTKTTRLEAVNTLLQTIGLAPINSLSGNKTADVIRAESVVDEVNREVQMMGWYFNTEEGYTLNITQSGEIPLPGNIMRIDYDHKRNRGIEPVIRGSRLYDKKNHTYKFNKSIKVTAVVAVPFEELPESARRYITIRGSRIYGDRMVGSESLNAFSRNDELQAWVSLREWEGDVADYNIFDSPDMAEHHLRGRHLPRGNT